MAIPTHLNHKPIIAVDNYDRIDGQYANQSDAKCLSIGQAQYDPNEISLKVFRQSKERWKRGSEELPIHRVLDLSILAIASMLTSENNNYPNSVLREEFVDNERVSEVLQYFQNNENVIRPRLEELKRVLDMFLDEVE